MWIFYLWLQDSIRTSLATVSLTSTLRKLTKDLYRGKFGEALNEYSASTFPKFATVQIKTRWDINESIFKNLRTDDNSDFMPSCRADSNIYSSITN